MNGAMFPLIPIWNKRKRFDPLFDRKWHRNHGFKKPFSLKRKFIKKSNPIIWYRGYDPEFGTLFCMSKVEGYHLYIARRDQDAFVGWNPDKHRFVVETWDNRIRRWQ